MQEEFSRRLGKSKYIDKFVLKGGFLLYSLGAGDTRATMDSDYLMKHLSNEELSVEKVIREIIEIDNIDIINFEFKGTERITEQNDYHGLRLKLVGAIGRSKTPIFIDIAIGDVIIPESCIISFETIITGFEKPRIRAYPIDTILTFTLPICEAIDEDRDYNKKWNFQTKSYIDFND